MQPMEDMLDSRIARPSPEGPACCCCYASCWDAGDGHKSMGARVRRRHAGEKDDQQDQQGGRGSIAGWHQGPAGDGAGCVSRHRCWISMGRCLAGRGRAHPCA